MMYKLLSQKYILKAEHEDSNTLQGCYSAKKKVVGVSLIVRVNLKPAFSKL